MDKSDDVEAVDAQMKNVALDDNDEEESTVMSSADVKQLTSQLMTNPDVLAAFSQKLGGMVGHCSGYIASLPKDVKRRLKALKRIQAEILSVEAKFYEEVHDLEMKYESIYAPLYKQREAVITGSNEPTDEECDWPSDEEEEIPKLKIVEIDETKPESEQNGEHEEKTTGVPEFWLTTLKNIDVFAAIIQDHDEPVLKSLQDIRVKLAPVENMGFTLEFVFGPNEYFTNSVLTKEYIMRSKPDPEHPLHYEGPEIVRCKGCKIDWITGKNVTLHKQKKKAKGGKKTVTKLVKCDSFFNFFTASEVAEDSEDDMARALQMSDFEAGQMLQERIIPRAVLYFTGEALDDSDGEYDEDDDEEGCEDEGEYDEDGDHDYSPPKGTKAGPGECKQS